MKTIIAITIGLIYVFGQNISAHSSQPSEVMTLAQQQEDLKIFRGALEEIHIGLNWFIMKKG